MTVFFRSYWIDAVETAKGTSGSTVLGQTQGAGKSDSETNKVSWTTGSRRRLENQINSLVELTQELGSCCRPVLIAELAKKSGPA
jgi:V8-like Glu-specific endopeptidase